MTPRQPDIISPGELLRAVRDNKEALRDKYINDPIGLANLFHLKMPRKPLQIMKELGKYDSQKHGEIKPGLRDLIEDVCLGEVTSAAVVGPRGGGKSMGVSFIEFYLVFVKMYDALNLGGSELQADQVYQYLLSYIDSNPYWASLIKGEPMRERTYTNDNAWIRVLTASQRSVRSPHAGGRKKDGRLAGGLLVIDEEAEAAPEIVSAALPTVNTARPSVVVRSSTFHNNEGSFADLIENHKTMGFKLYQWDIFDVAVRCDCTGDECQSEESCFRKDHVEHYADPDTGEIKKQVLHKAYCGGRAKYADGWVPMEEIVKLWRRMKRNHAVWEVEAMGSRPTSSGYVIKDRKAYAENVTDRSAASLFIPNCEVTICVDWGTVAAGITAWQEQPGDRHVLLEAQLVEEAGNTQIVAVIKGLQQKYFREFLEVRADIGGGGNYMNPSLREEHYLPTEDVSFAEAKEAAAAAWNIYNEANKVIYPEEFEEFHDQVKKWKRKNGRIMKVNDHLCDSSICYFSKFIDRLGLNHIRVMPRSFNSNGSEAVVASPSFASRSSGASHSLPPIRRARIRTIGGGNRR